MKKHRVKVRYIFSGYFDVMAGDRREAERIVGQECGLVMGGSIHTGNDLQVADWDFPIHPETKIVSVKFNK